MRVADRESAPVVAPLPEKLLERGLLAPGLLAHIAISKYADHLPLYRQEQIYRQRHGVDLSRQTMANGVALVGDWLRLVVDAMIAEQFAAGYVQIDETPVRNRGIDPYEYLRDVLTRLPAMANQQIAQITPAAWAAAKKAAARAEARQTAACAA